MTPSAMKMFAATFLLCFSVRAAQAPMPLHAGEIARRLERLSVVGSVLYVGAHPDDENTRLLAWLVAARHIRTGYLSLTRGDGGQNFVSPEQDAALGLIRTHELLAARRLDGAEQLFTRARDFGYSKTADETLKIWGHERVLSDLVLAIRRFQPDVIVTRYSDQPPNHGHHTASAILAREAFSAAADASKCPEQLAELKAWQSQRILYNLPKLPPEPAATAYLVLDVGGFDPLLGQSYGEIAAQSFRQHRSQGVWVPVQRDPVLEYFVPVRGSAPTRDIFDGVDVSWGRFPETQALIGALKEARAAFDPYKPYTAIPALIKVHRLLTQLPSANVWRGVKLREVESLIAACAGLFLQAQASAPSEAPGGQVNVELNAVNRSPAEIRLKQVTLTGGSIAAAETAVASNQPFQLTHPVKIPPDARVTTPYWLRLPGDFGAFEVDEADQRHVGEPTSEPALRATFHLEVSGYGLAVERPVLHCSRHVVRGEVCREFEIAPAVTATPDQEVVLFANGKPQNLVVVASAGTSNVDATVRLELPSGWRVNPDRHSVKLAAAGEKQKRSFRITPPRVGSAKVRVWVDGAGQSESWQERTTTAEHLPPLTIRQPAMVTLFSFPLVTRIRDVGYVVGAGDKVPERLASVG